MNCGHVSRVEIQARMSDLLEQKKSGINFAHEDGQSVTETAYERWDVRCERGMLPCNARREPCNPPQGGGTSPQFPNTVNTYRNCHLTPRT